MSLAVVAATSRRRVTLGSSLGRGGEGEILLADGGREVAKIYWLHKRSPELRRKLEVMVAHPPHDPMRARGFLSLAWPTELLLDPRGAVLGFLMPYLDTRKCRPLFQVYHPRSYPAGIDWAKLVQTARNLSAALEALHREGYVAGDLNESNVLAATNTVVSFVDCDSMQVPDPNRACIYRCAVGKPDYTPPELHGKDFSQIDRTPSSDRFALAVLVCQLLVRGRHPFSGRPPNSIADNIVAGQTIFANGFATAPGAMPTPDLLPPEVTRLFERAFVEGGSFPGRRPSAREWQDELDRLLARIRTCARLDIHKYSNHLGACPWCAFERVHGLMAFPKQRRSKRQAVGGSAPRSGPTGAVTAPGARQAPAIQPPATVGSTWSWPRPASGGTLNTIGTLFAKQARRAAAGCILGLLLVMGILMALPLLLGGGSRPASPKSAIEAGPGASTFPAGPLPDPVTGETEEEIALEDMLRQTLAARSNPTAWEQLSSSLRGRGEMRLAVGTDAVAELLGSEIDSALGWSWASEVQDLLSTAGAQDDEWLGDEGDRADQQGRHESAQALYCLAHTLDPDDREWLRKIEPRLSLRVRRGVDWIADYGSQDGGLGGTGVVTAVPPETPPGWVEVQWLDRQEKNWYRWGDEDKYELGLASPWSGSEA